MAITQQVFTLGTVTETIVAPSVDAAGGGTPVKVAVIRQD